MVLTSDLPSGGIIPDAIARHSRLAEVAVVLGLCGLQLASFGPGSPVHGPWEIFAQDSAYIWQSLADGTRYPWNPQNHLLYHIVLEAGFRGWKHVFGGGVESAFIYLKLFTLLTAVGFYLVLRLVLVALGLRPAQRIVLLLLTGFSFAIWFHFSAFETHGLALPALAGWLLSLVRLRERTRPTIGDRLLFVGSLLVMGWTRVDLFRFAVGSAALLVLPSVRVSWRDRIADLLLVALLGAAGSAWMAAVYFDIGLREAALRPFERDLTGRVGDPNLRDRLGRPENLTPDNLLVIGRAVVLYGMVMPIESRHTGTSFFDPPARGLDFRNRAGATLATSLFFAPARNLLGTALSSVVLAGVASVLVVAAVRSRPTLARGDPLHLMLWLQALIGWLFYVWFNPFEPFLWVAEFVPLWIVGIADGWRTLPRSAWVVLALVTFALALHNAFAFWLPLR